MERFCDKKIYVANQKKHGHKKNEFNFFLEKKEKELDFKNRLW